jgi:hypothetical protein
LANGRKTPSLSLANESAPPPAAKDSAAPSSSNRCLKLIHLIQTLDKDDDIEFRTKQEYEAIMTLKADVKRKVQENPY